MEKHLNLMAMTPPPSPPSTSPTTFVQADTTTFRDLVQKLTGFSGDSHKLPITHLSKLSSPAPPKPTAFTRRSPFKLHERRNVLRKLEIKLRNSNYSSKNQTYRFESPVLSPVTPLTTESSRFFSRSGMDSPLSPSVLKEDKAIADGGFYLHPSPLKTPRDSEPPELLNLFPSNSPSEQTQNA